jgi:putative PEP-CTERM system TPR-repeat lipoprotein
MTQPEGEPTVTISKDAYRNCRRLLTTLLAATGASAGFFLWADVSYASLATPPVSASTISTDPSGLNDLVRKADQAMAQDHPNVAVIYLKNAVNLAPKNAAVRTQLGYVLMKLGDMSGAVRELRTARQIGEPDAKVLPMLFEAMLNHSEAQLLLDQFPAPPDGDHSQLASATLRSRGIAFIQTGHPDLAAASLDKALAVSRDVPNLETRARLAAMQNDPVTAMKLVDEALSKVPHEPTALLLKITLLQKANRTQEALVAANDLVQHYYGNPTAFLARAGVYLQLQEDSKASADVQAVLKEHSNLPQALFYEALLKERAKDTKGAWDIAQALPPEFVNSQANTGTVIAEMAMSAGRSGTGMSILASLIARYPADVEPRIQLASQYLRQNEPQQALDTLLPVKDAQEPRVMVLLGQTYALLKNFAKSTEYFEKASSTGFGGDLLKKQIAASNLEVGNLDAAIKDYQELNAKDPGSPVTAGPLIAALLRKGDAADATKVANKLATSAPKSPYGPLFQGQLLLAQRDFGGAIAAFSRANAVDPKFVPAMYDRAVARFENGDAPGAKADIQLVLRTDPKNVMAMIRAAQFAMIGGQQTKALALLQKAVATEPKSTVTNLALASYYVGQKKLKEASATISRLLAAVPNDANALAMQGEIQLAEGAVEPAISTFRRLASGHPASPQIQMLLASALAAKHDTNGAMGAYQNAVKLAPQFPAARSSLIRYALSVNNHAVALSAAQDGVTQNPGPQSELVLAATYVTLHNDAAAINVLKDSIAKHPSAGAVVALSEIYRRLRNAKEADGLLSSWLGKHPDDVAVRIEYAQAQLTANPTLAIQQFREILKIQPNNIVALNNLGWVLQKKDPKQALEYAQEALRAAPNSPEVLDTLGWVKWEAKDGQGALPLLQRAHASDGKNPEITYHLAVVLHGTGHAAEAKRTLSDLLASKQEFDERAQALDFKW